MAKSTRKKATTKTFGRDVRVVVTEGEHQGIEGLTSASTPDSNGEYSIRLDDGSTISVHADSLGLAEEVIVETKKPILIREAKIKDDFCHYKYEIHVGIGAGDEHKVDGSGIIMDSMKNAFERLHVHFAAIDDVFKHHKMVINDIDEYHNDEHTMWYHVSGFKVTGDEEIDSIVLTGSKHTSLGSRIEFSTPKITLDNLSSYRWYNELKAAAEMCIREVELYKDGNYIIPAREDEEVENGKGKKRKGKQLTIGDQMESNSAEKADGEDQDDDHSDFDNAKV